MNLLLLAALIAVESGGNPNAIGDRGKAVGILQIHEITVQDVNRIAGTRYTPQDRLDPVKSADICRLYLNHYCTPARLGRPVTDEDRARIWNGGPNGWLKPSTVSYWHKVRRHL